jgi:phosphohistidine phosphatase SixA
MMQILADQAESFNDVLICGHNPGLADLARHLSGGAVDDLPTCALVVLEAELPSWSGLLQARCVLVSFEIPGKSRVPEAPDAPPG